MVLHGKNTAATCPWFCERLAPCYALQGQMVQHDETRQALLAEIGV
jgi:hypothetical protein